ncbi:PqqD family protein [Novispirillum itersonii]|uniref:PqqD family protein n=1 Tax=Novispirillum itersonii TaxID=189 RepID=UPI00037344A0|nr:PqqD family protein [Novispirillum itersonii]
MSGLSAGTTLVRNKDMLFSHIHHEVVIFHMMKGAYFSLDAIGADIWSRLDTPMTVAALCDSLTADYDGDRAEIERDVLLLLADMMDTDLVIPHQP